MRRILACVGVFVLLIFVAVPYRVAAASSLPIGFSQIKTRSVTAGDEFIELFNPDELAVELNGYKLVKETSSGAAYTILTFGQQQVLPQSFVLLALEGSSFAAQADKTYKTALADNNAIKLFDPNGILVDSLSWGDGKTLPNQPADQSYQRSWQSASMSWSNWQLTAFVSAHRSGDVLTISAPVEEDLVVPTPPVVTEPAPAPLPSVHLNEAQLLVTALDQPWIEIVVDSDSTVDTLTVLVDDQLFASLSGIFHAGQLVVVYKPTSFSASGHTIKLQTSTGAVVDELMYPAQNEQSLVYARFENSAWQWTAQSTSARPNVLATPAPATVCEAPAAIIPATPSPTSTPDNPPTAPSLRTDGRVLINEVFANPSGDESTDEFIELINEEDYALSLAGWKIADASKSTALPDIRIEAHGFVVLRRLQSSLTLNNGAETISLFNPSSQLVASLSYDAAAEDKSWNIGEPWYESTPTPGAQNASLTIIAPSEQESAPVLAPTPTPTLETETSQPTIVNPPLVEAHIATATHQETMVASSSNVIKKAVNSSTIKETSFAKWPSVKANSKVTIVGVITAPPGVFGEKSATIQDVTGAFPGIELYFSAANWPSLDEGDILQVTGKKSSAKTGDRMLISSVDDFVVLDHMAVDAMPLSIGELTSKQHRTVVSIEARLVENKNGVLTVTDDQDELHVSVKKAGLEPDLGILPVEGRLTGIFIDGKTPELWLRNLDDIELRDIAEPIAVDIVRAEEKTESKTSEFPKTTITAAPATTKPTPWLAPVAAVGSAGGLSWYFFQDALRQHGLKLLEKLRK